MDKCMSCTDKILPGAPYVSLNLHRETFDGETVKVIEAHVLRIWCEHCALGVFGSVCCDDSYERRDSDPGDKGETPSVPSQGQVAVDGSLPADLVDTIEVYLVGLAIDDPAITEEVRQHILSLAGDGNAEFLTVLLKAIRDGLADS